MSILSFESVKYLTLDLSFSIEEREHLHCIVPNEASHDIFLKLVTGFVKPEDGDIRFEDISILNNSHKKNVKLRKQISIVEKYGGLLSNITVWENIIFPEVSDHGKLSDEETALALRYLNEGGYSAQSYTLPSELSLYDKYLVAFVGWTPLSRRAIILKTM